MFPKWGKIALIGFVFYFVEMSLGHLFDIKGVRPDLMLIYVAFLAVHHDNVIALIAGFFAGLFQDITAIHFVGVYALIKATIGFWGACFFQTQTVQFKFWMFPIFVFVAGIIQFTWSGIFLLLGADMSFIHYFVTFVLPSSFYTASFAFLLHLIPGVPGLFSERGFSRLHLRDS